MLERFPLRDRFSGVCGGGSGSGRGEFRFRVLYVFGFFSEERGFAVLRGVSGCLHVEAHRISLGIRFLPV